jgi:acetyl esterase/lipase
MTPLPFIRPALRNWLHCVDASAGGRLAYIRVMRTIILMALLFALTACASTRLVNAFIPSSGYQVHGNLGYGELPRQALDVYVPTPQPRQAPVVLFFYGGRWSGGDRDFYRFVGQALSSRGYVAVIADYRLYPEVKFPAFVEDGALAVRWVREHISGYGGDPQKLFVMGHSAGAHIAAMLAIDPQYLRAVGGSREWLSGMIGLSGPYDFLPLTDDDLKDMFGPPSRYAQSQPVNFVDGQNPPLLLLHGRTDTTVRLKNTLNLADKVRQQGGVVQTEIYPVMGHVRMVASLAAPLRFTSSVLEDVSAFIQSQSKGRAR